MSYRQGVRMATVLKLLTIFVTMELFLGQVSLADQLPTHASSRQNRPGFRGRITQKGLDYGVKVGLDLLMLNLQNLQIPEFEETVAGTKMIVSNMTIVDFPYPDIRISLIPNPNQTEPGGIRAEATNVNFTLQSSLKILFNMGFFTVTQNVELTVTASNVVMVIQAHVGLNSNRTGQLHMTSLHCNASGEVDITFGGDWGKWGSLLGSVIDLAKTKIKEVMFTQICDNFKTFVTTNLERELSGINMTSVIYEDYILDYTLTEIPKFTENFVESNHKGVIHLVDDDGNTPYNSVVFPQLEEHSDRMAYVFITDYFVNSIWHSARRNNKLVLNVTHDMAGMPTIVKQYLSTSCQMGIQCLGRIFPLLNQLYPNSAIEVDIHAGNSTGRVFKLRGQVVSLHAHGTAEFYIRTRRSRDLIFKLNMAVSGSLRLHFKGEDRLIFNITNFSVNSDVIETHVGQFTQQRLRTFLSRTVRQFLFPYLKELGLQGWIIPSLPEFRLRNPLILDKQTEGVFVFGTDFEFNPASLNLEESAQAKEHHS